MTDSPKAVLEAHRLRPKQSWGQNFLGDDHALSRIAKALSLVPGEPVVELGAGLGHLTRHLLETGARVVAVERDRELVFVLEELRHERLTVLAANAAELDFARAAAASRVAVVGNLPYHLTSPILFQLLSQRATVSRAVFTLQREVVTRLSASPGGRDYGLLSALLGLYFDIEELFVLPAQLFHPRPKVDSAVVRLTSLPSPRAAVTGDERFKKVVKAGFAHRRKTLLNSLDSDKSLGGRAAIAAALERAGIDGVRRAETLSSVEFAALERALPP
ncbi:MAG: 16S rRNA (adenine(1518)-N(6)/adenine(1519)-N(6))-dimethyltransferase RsmA [Myxococcaceae bacterium]